MPLLILLWILIPMPNDSIVVLRRSTLSSGFSIAKYRMSDGEEIWSQVLLRSGYPSNVFKYDNLAWV